MTVYHSAASINKLRFNLPFDVAKQYKRVHLSNEEVFPLKTSNVYRGFPLTEAPFKLAIIWKTLQRIFLCRSKEQILKYTV